MTAHAAPGSIQDPVCGADLGPAGSVYTLQYRGTTHQFCSARCKESFRATPHAYVKVGLLGRVAALWRGLAKHSDAGGRCC
jgi:YHS domain-containing protein